MNIDVFKTLLFLSKYQILAVWCQNHTKLTGRESCKRFEKSRRVKADKAVRTKRCVFILVKTEGGHTLIAYAENSENVSMEMNSRKFVIKQ